MYLSWVWACYIVKWADNAKIMSKMSKYWNSRLSWESRFNFVSKIIFQISYQCGGTPDCRDLETSYRNMVWMQIYIRGYPSKAVSYQPSYKKLVILNDSRDKWVRGGGGAVRKWRWTLVGGRLRIWWTPVWSNKSNNSWVKFNTDFIISKKSKAPKVKFIFMEDNNTWHTAITLRHRMENLASHPRTRMADFAYINNRVLWMLLEKAKW